MKQIYLFFALLFATTLFAQIPQGFSYQAVALNSSGNAVASAPVKVRLSILDNSATGTAVYTETHNPTSNNMGLFTLTIGQGTPVTGTFSNINWGQNSKFLKVEIDVTNGTNYITIGSSQLLAVPYAMYAGAIAGMGGSNGTTINDLFLYGSFNNFNASTALQLYDNGYGPTGYKYFTGGTQLKFITALNSNTPYGNGGSGVLSTNGSNFTINSNGIYRLRMLNQGPGINAVYINSVAFNVVLFGQSSPMTYNPTNNTLTTIVSIPYGVPAYDCLFKFSLGDDLYGDNLINGNIELNGTPIQLPGEGNYKIDLNLNFTGDGSTYTITPVN